MKNYFILLLVILVFGCNNERVLQLPEIENAEAIIETFGGIEVAAENAITFLANLELEKYQLKYPPKFRPKSYLSCVAS